ncbi:HU family DNA-binding protein [Streptomyces sp. NPDC059785]|uniref:HU family DNA-binding protein n=1 Tax=unclassified Streptomyces TaxID=2593676 RepID=UPI00364F7CEB
MDRTRLIEATTQTSAHHDDDRRLTPDDVGQVLDSVFGTVEHPGSIAQALDRGETVLLGSFGSFHPDGRTATFRPGKALTEFLHGTTR